MKAFRIISSEYKHNEPSIFLFHKGEYYGDLIYPWLRKFPQNIEYWREATCADSDRYFSVIEVEITEMQLEILKKYHADIQESRSSLKEYSSMHTYKEVCEYNKPYEDVISKRNKEMRNLIMSLK